jgi:hypothetical protein
MTGTQISFIMHLFFLLFLNRHSVMRVIEIVILIKFSALEV